MNGRGDPIRLPAQAVKTPRGTRPARSRVQGRFPWAYLAAFLFGTTLISTFIWFQIESERQTVLANWRARVVAIAEGRARLVSDWFTARHADADVLASSPAVRALMLDGGRVGDARSQIVPQLGRGAAAYGYAGISLMDTQGRVLARSTGAAELGRDSGASAVVAARTRTMRVDLFEEPTRKLLSGRELAQRLQPLRPDMKVLYMSGYTDDAIVRRGVLGAGMAFLSKPFTLDALALKIREVLDAGPHRVERAVPFAGAPANSNGADRDVAVSAAAGPVVQRAEDVGTARPWRV